jgi:hypothetical protein
MMNERFIYLTEMYLEEQLNEIEKNELFELLEKDTLLKEEFNEQIRIKEVLNKMRMKNPSNEVWDNYWLSIYNRTERKIAWIFFLAGALILVAFGAYNFVEEFLIKDDTTPLLIKWGVALLIVGLLILFVSIIREKLFTYKNDKYREVQR